MILFRVLTILVLTVGIFGTAAYFAYDLYWKPQQLDREDKIASKAAAEATAAATPVDYSLPSFQRAMNTATTGGPQAAREALAAFIKDYPDSPNLAIARKTLGDVNVEEFFSPTAAPDKVAYTVASRDSLAKIAGKFKSNAELIFRVNNLESINLQIGQQLFIPQPKIAVVIDHKAKTITLNNNGAFLKEYPVVAFKGSFSAAETKVLDKFAVTDDKRVAFGDKNYAGADRVVMLSGGLSIRGVAADAKTAPAGISVSIPDMDEIFLLVNRATPVTIR